MLDTWNLQSLGPRPPFQQGRFTAFPGETRPAPHLRQQPVGHASDRLFTGGGRVHLTRDGRLLSVQNFTMGNLKWIPGVYRTVFTMWKLR